MTSIDRTRPQSRLHIGSDRGTTGSGGVYEHVDPTTGRVDATVPLAGPCEIEEAVHAAQAAFESWRWTKPAERRRLLLRLADLVEQNSDEFTRRGVLDNGSPLKGAAGHLPIITAWTRYYAGFADKVTTDLTSSLMVDGELCYTLAQPYGVVGMIITWNGPLTQLGMKVPSALAAGNTLVIKPSELTPFVPDLFAELVEEAGFPPGVVNILTGGPDAGEALVSHELVKKISFTGGPATAQAILRSCATQFKSAVLELGGKSANIIFSDADLDAACTWGTRRAIADLAGQGCNFPSRMIVHEDVYDEVLERATTIAKNIKVGDPFDWSTDTGPVVSRVAMERILGIVERAKLSDARLVVGGSRLGGPLADGFYIEPTIFAEVDPASELAQEEVFGPVLAVTKFSTEEEAIKIANSTKYGLSSYIQTNDLRRALRVSEQLEAGGCMINGAQNLTLNRPFGGIGMSGYGKEGGRQGLEEFQRIKTVAIA